MRPAMWTSFLIEMSPEEMARAFAEKGWREMELSDEHGAMLMERGDPTAVGEAFRRHAEDLGVAFPQGHLWLSCDVVAENQDEILDRLKPWLDLFVAAGVKAGVLHPGGHKMTKAGAAPERVRELRLRGMAEAAAHVAGEDFLICLENCPPTASTADELVDIIEAVGSDRLAICLDTGHLNISKGNENQGDFIRRAGDRLKALHIADNEGATDQHLMPYGRGTVDWEDVVAALKAIGYAGLFNFEIPGENRCPVEARLAKLDYLKAILPTLLGDAAP